MKWSTMVMLREQSNIIKRAMDFGFDLPRLRDALEQAQESLTDDDLPGIKSKVKDIIDKLSVNDLGMLIGWLFEPDSVDPNAIISELSVTYEQWAEMWMDEESETIAERLLQEAQAIYNETKHYAGTPDPELSDEGKSARADLASKLMQIESLTGKKVESDSDGVLGYIKQDSE